MSGVDTDSSPSDSAERWVERCFELSRELGPQAVDRVCEEAPRHADEVRERLARLGRVGMLPPELAGEAKVVDGARRVGRYVLLDALGAGGMGIVYSARDEATGDIVALKTADPRVPWNDRMRERFRREIEAAQRIDHPNALGILDVGEEAGVPFYTMPFVRGATLGELLDRLRKQVRAGEPPSLQTLATAWNAAGSRGPRARPEEFGRSYTEAVCLIAAEVADALEHVHACGIVHRDLKPSNVFVDAGGRALLFDLGLAHLVDDTRLTHTGDFAGSPHYAAPEQITAQTGAIDARTDVYGLGATLFELCALRPPFRGKSAADVMRRIVREEAPPLRSVAPWVPRDLETICRTCLEKQPRQRYGSAAELAADLRRFVSLEPIAARPVGVVRRAARFARRNPWATLAGVLVTAIVVLGPLGLALHVKALGDQRDEAQAAAAEARREAEENREVSRFLEALILDLDRSPRPTDRAAAGGLIEGARQRLRDEASILPLTRAGLMDTVAGVLAGMDRADDAIALLDRSLQIRQRELGEQHPETMSTVQELAGLHLERGDLVSARGLAERGRRQVQGRHGAATSRAFETLGRLAHAEGDAAQAAALLREAHATLRSTAPDPLEEARLLRRLGAALRDAGRPAEAEEVLDECVRLGESVWNPDPLELAQSFEALAQVQVLLDESAAATTSLQRALDLHRKRGHGISRDAERILGTMVTLAEGDDAERDTASQPIAEAWLLLGENRLARDDATADDAFERALAGFARLEPIDPELRARAHLGRADVAVRAGDASAARRALDAAERHVGSGSERTWVHDLHRLRLEWIALETADDASPELVQTWLAEARSWYRSRVAAVTVLDLELVAGLRERAERLLGLGFAEPAEVHLAEARQLEQRFGLGLPTPEPAPRGGVAGDVYFDAMQRGITSLQSERWSDACDAFRVCMEVRPGDAVAPYNLACALALLGDRDAAFEALETAMDRGYAHREDAVALTAADPDLVDLRADPRWAALMDRVRADVARAEAYVAEPAVYAPVGVVPESAAALLVVLHADGRTKDEVVSGPWAVVAERLGALLVAPSARIPVERSPEHGMRWSESLERYVGHSRFHEDPVWRAVARVRQRWTIDPGRVYVAGEGFGGTVAFHCAVRAPELFRGALLVDALPRLEMVDDLAPSLTALDLRVALLARPDLTLPAAPSDEPTAALLSRRSGSSRGSGCGPLSGRSAPKPTSSAGSTDCGSWRPVTRRAARASEAGEPGPRPAI